MTDQNNSSYPTITLRKRKTHGGKMFHIDFNPSWLIDNGYYLHGESTYTIDEALHLIKAYYNSSPTTNIEEEE